MKRQIQSQEVSDAFWNAVKTIIPKTERDPLKKYKRQPGGGRKPLAPRKVLEAILFVLRTGIPWRKLPKQVFGSSSAIHQYFIHWERSGFFQELWNRGLVECDEMEGIAWEWRRPDQAEYAFQSALQGCIPDDDHASRQRTTERRVWRPVIERRRRTRKVCPSAR